MRTGLAIAACMVVATGARAQTPTEAAQREAREILDEMVAANTSLQHGDVTPLAESLAERFIHAGVPAADVVVIGPEAKNKNLVVRIRGKGQGKAVLFLAHLDVVDALRADWSTEPFAVTDKDGWLYGRGTIDDKGPATTLVAGMLSLVRSKAVPTHDIILALTSGEENADDPGAAWLVRTHRELVDAEYVFNFDAGGPSIDRGKLAWVQLQSAEKVYWTVTLATHNAGGHSSLPRADNAIYQLVNALRGLEALSFPVHVTDVARAQMIAWEPFVAADEAALLRAAAKEPLDSADAYRLARFAPSYNALLRTTCIPTMLTAGHAENALPAAATATVNCRLIPGEKTSDILAAIKQAVADTGVHIAELAAAKSSPASPLLPERIAMVKSAIRATWGRDVPIIPAQENGATDGLYFRNVGIPVYGVLGLPMPTGEERMHGNDERIPSRSLREGVTFATALIREAAGVSAVAKSPAPRARKPGTQQ